jgi:hypothetical protein
MKAHNRGINNAKYTHNYRLIQLVCGIMRFVDSLVMYYPFVLAKSGNINLIHHLLFHPIRH